MYNFLFNVIYKYGIDKGVDKITSKVYACFYESIVINIHLWIILNISKKLFHFDIKDSLNFILTNSEIINLFKIVSLSLIVIIFITLCVYYNTGRINKNMSKYIYKKDYDFYMILILGVPIILLMLTLNI